MTVRYVLTLDGWITEANYLHCGRPMCARLGGQLTTPQVIAVLYMRRSYVAGASA